MRKVPIPFTQRLADLLRGPVALLVWLGAAGTASWMLLSRPIPVTHVAWVPTIISEVTAPADGIIDTLSARPGTVVSRGAVLGRLDDAPLRARLATEMARIGELQARLDAAEAREADGLASIVQDLEIARADEARRYAADLRRYQGDQAELALDVLALEVTAARDEVEIERLGVRLARAQGLVADGIGPVADVEDLSLRKLETETALGRTRVLLERTSVERDAAAERLASFLDRAPVDIQALVPADALGGMRAAVTVQERAVAEVSILLDRLVLVAPIDGQVLTLLCREGQTVRAGSPVVSIVEEVAPHAVLYLDPKVASTDFVGRPVELSLAGAEPAVVESTIAWVAPHVALLPECLWLSPDLPRYGRAARVPLGESRPFLPGQVLGARLLGE